MEFSTYELFKLSQRAKVLLSGNYTQPKNMRGAVSINRDVCEKFVEDYEKLSK